VDVLRADWVLLGADPFDWALRASIVLQDGS
jgi:hypothetical protein